MRIAPTHVIAVIVSDDRRGVIVIGSPPLERVGLFGPVPIVRSSRKNVTSARARPFVGAAKTLVFIETRIVGDVPGCRSPLGRIDAILTCAGHSRRATRAGNGTVYVNFPVRRSRSYGQGRGFVQTQKFDGRRLGRGILRYRKIAARRSILGIYVDKQIAICSNKSLCPHPYVRTRADISSALRKIDSRGRKGSGGRIRSDSDLSRRNFHRPGNRVHVVDHVVPSRRRKRRTAACLRKRAPSRGCERRADSKNRERQEESDADSRSFRHIGNDVLFHIKNKLRI